MLATLSSLLVATAIFLVVDENIVADIDLVNHINVGCMVDYVHSCTPQIVEEWLRNCSIVHTSLDFWVTHTDIAIHIFLTHGCQQMPRHSALAQSGFSWQKNGLFSPALGFAQETTIRNNLDRRAGILEI
jgi:hypothetical protein